MQLLYAIWCKLPPPLGNGKGGAETCRGENELETEVKYLIMLCISWFCFTILIICTEMRIIKKQNIDIQVIMLIKSLYWHIAASYYVMKWV
jgi:hypothetical protein